MRQGAQSCAVCVCVRGGDHTGLDISNSINDGEQKCSLTLLKTACIVEYIHDVAFVRAETHANLLRTVEER